MNLFRMTMPDFSAYLDSFTATCKRCGHVHDIMLGDIPKDHKCNFCKKKGPPGFHWHPQIKAWVYTDVEKAKELKELVNEYVASFFNIAPGDDIPYTEEIIVNAEPGRNRDIVSDPKDVERRAVIDYPESSEPALRQEYRERYIDSLQVLNTDEGSTEVKGMRQFEDLHGIRRLVVPDEQPRIWGERAGN